MGDAADDLREKEEEWELMLAFHKRGDCLEDCPFCYEEDIKNRKVKK